MNKERENEEKYFTFKEIRDDYFENYEIKGYLKKCIESVLFNKIIFYVVGILMTLIMLFIFSLRNQEEVLFGIASKSEVFAIIAALEISRLSIFHLKIKYLNSIIALVVVVFILIIPTKWYLIVIILYFFWKLIKKCPKLKIKIDKCSEIFVRGYLKLEIKIDKCSEIFVREYSKLKIKIGKCSEMLINRNPELKVKIGKCSEILINRHPKLKVKVNYLNKSESDNEKKRNQKYFHIDLSKIIMYTGVYWIGSIVNFRKINHFLVLICFLTLIIIIMLLLYARLIWYGRVYLERKYIIEGINEKSKELSLQNLNIESLSKKDKYKRLKKEIIKYKNQKFFEDYPQLNNIKIIDFLIESCEKVIMQGDKKINQPSIGFGGKEIISTTISTIFSTLVPRMNFLDWGMLLGYIILWLIVNKVMSFFKKIFTEEDLSFIKKNKQFKHILEERKLILLQQQLENNHLPSIEIGKEKEETIDNKLILG